MKERKITSLLLNRFEFYMSFNNNHNWMNNNRKQQLLRIAFVQDFTNRNAQWSILIHWSFETNQKAANSVAWWIATKISLKINSIST